MDWEAAYDRAVGTLYEAALDPDRWPEVLVSAGRVVGGQGADVWTGRRDALTFWTIGVEADPDALKPYAAYYHAIDPRAGLLERMPVGQAFSCAAHLDEAFARKSEFYNDFLMPIGYRYVMGMRVPVETGLVTFGVHRKVGADPFEAADFTLLRRLASHVGQAMMVQGRIGKARVRERGFGEALDRLSLGVMIVDGAGRVLDANRRAEAMFRAGDGLRSQYGRLRAGNQRESEALLDAIAGAVRTAGGRGDRGGRTLRIKRASGEAYFVVSVSPVAPVFARGDLRDAPCALVIVSDPTRRVRPCNHALAEVFGLTPAEEQLAIALLDGLTPDAIARARNVGIATVRTQLRQLFAKTGTERQAELVRLLAAVSAV